MDEPALIKSAQRGDVDAFNMLVLAYQSQVYNVPYRIMGDKAPSMDATQETFISAYKNIKKYRGGSFKGWLLRTVTNACYDALRYNKRRPFTSLERVGNNTLGIALTLLLTGFFLMINRRKALTQVLALLTVENGVMLAAVALTTYGMPLVVELGIFFDVLVAVMVLGILVYRIRENFASMDTSKLNQLKG